MEIRTDDPEKTAFITGQGLRQFKVMPFGLCNASIMFKNLMETVLRYFSYETCLGYLGLIIVGRIFKKHLSMHPKVTGLLQKIVLLQKVNSQEHTIAYWNKCLSKPERSYCTIGKELLFIIKSLEQFHHYLYGCKFLF